MISAENLSKSYARQTLFDDVSFKINPRERVGLVGRNGHGKTTLLRMIVGEETPDAGQIVIPKGYRMGYVRQHLDFTEDTVLGEGMKGLPESQKGQHWKVEKVLAGLGFSQQDMQRSPYEFSGGYQVRLNLAKVLVSEPDLLLLDEPTNYLDITSIRWIERFLISWPHELLLITHDRTFMDRIVTHTMGIHRRKIRKIQGDTEKYYAQIAQDEEVYEKTRINDERKRKEVEAFISQFRAKARLVGLVQSRIRTLEKMEKKDKLEKIKTLDFSFRYEPFVGKYVLAAQDLNFSYDPSTELIRDFTITLRPGEKVCIIGPNGKGKTTLLKLLAGTLAPRSGEITRNPKTVLGVFEQTNVSSLVDTRTVEEEIIVSYSDIDRQKARDICGAMLFEGDYALKKIEVLSGGEKSRVMLGKLLATPVNLLLLDEPTNHLDMESSDALLAALDSFEGAVVMVTHNEMFLHALAERLIIFKNGSIEVFEGGYQRFLEKGGWGDEEVTPLSAKKAKPERDNGEKLDKKELRKRRAGVITERSRMLGPLEKEISRVENAIDTRDKKLKTLHAAMQEATLARDGKRISEISMEIHVCEQEIESLFTELEALTHEFDRINAEFEERLSTIEQL
ncbi:MAG: ABC-F family ATP-binding cassette domain-containing protein [Pseudomonadota bacterium]|jgi:ATP-binding cassette subfamily F protein 3|nr:ABC-F family ATP-binding cassette domain-containing protein [Pseudomonadota bacterium]HON38039.1 ABC-F family ATP-binding cassette domain-containing protein [Deltaproteobacteria bacterium]HRS55258.1 ABC-F family ATP-binding cassette domain-containing protein [Desulfomonilia bacterium]HPD20424.1 ABC-F family ATP-binding cassette domain-containing protein [Deltaproteobacteria bacterium]HPW69411.1 ABC-F family ATP-binding cassette domain-containing protein [Deltaproteobacteria bacterium]